MASSGSKWLAVGRMIDWQANDFVAKHHLIFKRPKNVCYGLTEANSHSSGCPETANYHGRACRAARRRRIADRNKFRARSYA